MTEQEQEARTFLLLYTVVCLTLGALPVLLVWWWTSVV